MVDDVDANLAGRGSGVAITDVVGCGHEKLCVVAAEHGPRDRSGKITESCEATEGGVRARHKYRRGCGNICDVSHARIGAMVNIEAE